MPPSSPEKRTRSMDDIRPRKTPFTAIIGLSHEGLPLAIAAAKHGRVIGFDSDEVKIAQLHQREAPFLSDDENAFFKDSENIRLTHDPKDLQDADVFVICTPPIITSDHEPDFGPLLYAASIVGGAMRADSLIIVESEINPGVSERLLVPSIAHNSGLPERSILYAHVPAPNRAHSIAQSTRIVGGITQQARDLALQFYQPLVEAPLIPLPTLRETEAVTLLRHALRDTCAALVNELAIGFDSAGIDIVPVIQAASQLPPEPLPLPTCGVSSHDLPDPEHLLYGEPRFDYRLLMTARRINTTMPLYTVKLAEIELQKRNQELDGAHIALIGITRADDHVHLRGSPALSIRKELERRGALVRTFDPYAPAASSARTLRQALDGADAAIIAANHPQFRTLTPQQFEELSVPIVIDGTDLLDKEAFARSDVKYRGIGRS